MAGLLAAGCSYLDYVEIVNETTTGVMISACGREERIGDGLRFGAAARCLFPLRIRSSYGHWTYHRPADATVPVLSDKHFVGRTLRLRLASDGSLTYLSSEGWEPIEPGSVPPLWPDRAPDPPPR